MRFFEAKRFAFLDEGEEGSAAAIPLWRVATNGLEDRLEALPAPAASWARQCGFTGRLGEVLLLPDGSGAPMGALIGWGDAAAHQRQLHPGAAAAQKLPEGVYYLAPSSSPSDRAADFRFARDWGMAAYRFSGFRVGSPQKARLLLPDGIDHARLCAELEGEFLTRDLINRPANDLGPAELEAALHHVAEHHGASFSAITGKALLKANFPLIHAVGRAATKARAPRLLDLRWGDPDHPAVTFVGKGVCFDTGGLNLKPGASMGLMKKDMGGAAVAIGLAHMIMALELPVRLRLLVPAVENAVSSGAFRPQDILRARNGLSVEVNNTDAEGRLVLADALALAVEEPSELLISLATLTGAARVALGAEIVPYFTDDTALSAELLEAGTGRADPLWPLPLWAGYEEMIEPGIADLDNAPAGGFGGAITAALFLRRFTHDHPHYVHLDLYGWSAGTRPGRPKGGLGQGARALLEVIATRYGR